jgi:TPR repeat protein
MAFALVAGACGPLIVMAPETGSGPATRQLELDEAKTRCGRGEPCACYAVGAFHGNNGDYNAARKMLDRGCKGGCAAACADLSDAYFEEKLGAERDDRAGTRYAILACRLDPGHCEAGGERFELGSGPKRDLGRAKAFFDQGCRAGDNRCCAALERVRGFEPDPEPPAAADAGRPAIADAGAPTAVDAGAAPAVDASAR